MPCPSLKQESVSEPSPPVKGKMGCTPIINLSVIIRRPTFFCRFLFYTLLLAERDAREC
jgi:hypothetical protein